MDIIEQLNSANEVTWLLLGQFAESIFDLDKALYSYENALKFNPYNVRALTQIACLYRLQENYDKAAEYFKRILNIENNGEVWGALGHCYLMTDNLQKAYAAYQQALYYIQNPTDPNLWYGIGILYDRYGSFEHSEEAFSAVLVMDPNFEKANEIYFRLGISYKNQKKYEQALECFQRIVHNPPPPLIEVDIYFQIGHIYEMRNQRTEAKESYEKVLKEIPKHAKALQQLGWLYHGGSSPNLDLAIQYLQRALEADPGDAQTHYLLGRCYMAQHLYRKAHDAYQEAVYRDSQNPTFWCSIGILYYQINQYRDALDAYSRAIRLNPFLPEVWYNLGTLYESCHQPKDSLDAYQRALDLDSGNSFIKKTLENLKEQIARGTKNRMEGLITMEPRNFSAGEHSPQQSSVYGPEETSSGANPSLPPMNSAQKAASSGTVSQLVNTSTNNNNSNSANNTISSTVNVSPVAQTKSDSSLSMLVNKASEAPILVSPSAALSRVAKAAEVVGQQTKRIKTELVTEDPLTDEDLSQNSDSLSQSPLQEPTGDLKLKPLNLASSPTLGNAEAPLESLPKDPVANPLPRAPQPRAFLDSVTNSTVERHPLTESISKLVEARPNQPVGAGEKQLAESTERSPETASSVLQEPKPADSKGSQSGSSTTEKLTTESTARGASKDELASPTPTSSKPDSAAKSDPASSSAGQTNSTPSSTKSDSASSKSSPEKPSEDPPVPASKQTDHMPSSKVANLINSPPPSNSASSSRKASPPKASPEGGLSSASSKSDSASNSDSASAPETPSKPASSTNTAKPAPSAEE